MAIRKDFCAFILTHGRPDKVHTYNTLKRAGYTGKIYIVIDDEDVTADKYREKFGCEVVQFCKSKIASQIDEGDNFDDRRAIIYARNACWEIAANVGCRYFIQLDDDYNSGFYLRFNSRMEYGYTHRIDHSIDDIFNAMIDFYINCGALSVAMTQGGDHIGGGKGKFPSLKRKCMNSFICSTDRPFKFFGRVNEDVNTYTTLGRRGFLFFSITQAQVNQLSTQSNKGGMTDIYLESGTYLKTFYSVMYSPSCVKVGYLGDPRSPHYRIHHKINWHHTVPKILNEKWKRAEHERPKTNPNDAEGLDRQSRQEAPAAGRA